MPEKQKNQKAIYQFKITLKGSKPPIWRRIQVPKDYTFWELHVAIQSAMSWTGYHLHSFAFTDPKTQKIIFVGTPLGKDAVFETYYERDEKIKDYFSQLYKRCVYTYDFGDNWEHEVLFEKELPAEKEVYPKCVKGVRACPPEDCGGIGGYYDLLEARSDPNHEMHEEANDLLDGMWGISDEFDVEEIYFSDPEEAWEEYEEFLSTCI